MTRLSLRWAKTNPLLSAAIAIAVIGLLVLFIGARSAQPQPSRISDLPSLKEGTYVSFVGEVRSISQRDRDYNVMVCESAASQACASVIVSKSSLPITLVDGDYVSVKGIIRSYSGRTSVATGQRSDFAIIQPAAR